jgi:hypothetical protein
MSVFRLMSFKYARPMPNNSTAIIAMIVVCNIDFHDRVWNEFSAVGFVVEFFS